MLGTTFSLLLLATPGAADGLALSAVSGLVPSGALPMTVLSALSSDRLRALPTDGEGYNSRLRKWVSANAIPIFLEVNQILSGV